MFLHILQCTCVFIEIRLLVLNWADPFINSRKDFFLFSFNLCSFMYCGVFVFLLKSDCQC
jgi:hypothetical protein